MASGGLALNWLKSCLNKRVQYIELIGEGNVKYKSKKRIVEGGIPQGSNLGPLLFIVYINELLNLRGVGNLTVFADDCTAIIEGDSYETLQENTVEILNRLNKWFSNNNL